MLRGRERGHFHLNCKPLIFYWLLKKNENQICEMKSDLVSKHEAEASQVKGREERQEGETTCGKGRQEK